MGITAFLFEEVHVGYAVALWRVAFGLCLIYTALVTHVEITRVVEFTSFTIPLIDGLPMLSAPSLWPLLAAFLTAAIFVTLGVFYKPSIIVATVLHTYFFLLCKAAHNNHYYLISILGALLAMVPADQNLSLRMSFCKCRTSAPPGDDDIMPRWHFLVHKLQIALVYFYAGIAKLDRDWLEGRFMFKVCSSLSVLSVGRGARFHGDRV